MIVMMIAMNAILSLVDHCGVFRIVNASYPGLKAELLVLSGGLSGVLSEGMICTNCLLTLCILLIRVIHSIFYIGLKG